jgi:uncharacterized protein
VLDIGPDLHQTPAIITELVVKVAARCNIDCSYCYWFRDPSVYRKPKLMSAAVVDQLLARVKEHIVRHSPTDFRMTLHGGEPLLWGMANLQSFADKCRSIASETGCAIEIGMTTNAVLIDEDWLDCFEKNDVKLGVSLDGPAHVHDVHRRTFADKPTHAQVERGVRLLQSRNISFGVLAVCNPAYTAKDYFEYFSNIGVDDYDIMFPDTNFDEQPKRIDKFYKDLFDYWLVANQKQRTVRIRDIEAMVSGLIGAPRGSDAIGYGPEEICTILTDGSIEPLDVLRIAGDSSTQTNCNVFDNALQDVVNDPRWQAARHASLNLCEKCRSCKYMKACGGGYLPHRFAKANGYDNPSVYCDDIYAIFEHMQNMIRTHVHVSKPTGEQVNVYEAVAQPIDELWSADNGFASYKDMQASHAVIVDLAIGILAKCSGSAPAVIDLGCGNGALLRKLCDASPSLRGFGIELSREKVVRANTAFRDPRISIFEGDLYDSNTVLESRNYSLAIVALDALLLDDGRLQSFIRERADALLIYAYPSATNSRRLQIADLAERGFDLRQQSAQNDVTGQQTFAGVVQIERAAYVH